MNRVFPATIVAVRLPMIIAVCLPMLVAVGLLSGCTMGTPSGKVEKKPMRESENADLPAFDDWWDYGDPAGTEARFRELLPRAEAAGRPEYLAELLTQIARTRGLQQDYAGALALLDRADTLVTHGMTSAWVRSRLERGRVFNSSGRRAESVPHFTRALERAKAAGLEFFAVDAAHMLGIVTSGNESLRWNEEAIRMSEAATDPRARRWLGSLYNNTGWTCFDMERFDEALALFEKCRRFQHEAGKRREEAIAQWSIGKTLRRQGKVEEALVLQRSLLDHPDRRANDSEGYTREEIGECLLLLGRGDEARPEFARAWELLKDDPWLVQDEPERLTRLKELGGLP